MSIVFIQIVIIKDNILLLIDLSKQKARTTR